MVKTGWHVFGQLVKIWNGQTKHNTASITACFLHLNGDMLHSFARGNDLLLRWPMQAWMRSLEAYAVTHTAVAGRPRRMSL